MDKAILDKLLTSVEKNVPPHLASGVDVIYVGDFEEFEEKRFNAAYEGWSDICHKCAR